ncbi:MAG: ATP-binding protein, partial [Gammaproteobacteria bacterium]|nr:ATP-binding protein [Gammaproteobacteria bacterium]
SISFPARFQFVAAMNPCPCGFAGDTTRECRCSADQVRRYQHKISGPLLDRLQIRPRIGRCPPRILDRSTTQEESTATVRERVLAATATQARRSNVPNARLRPDQVRRWCMPDREGAQLLEHAAARFTMSMRACDDAMRVARTIADLAGAKKIRKDHVAEALALRGVNQCGPADW